MVLMHWQTPMQSFEAELIQNIRERLESESCTLGMVWLLPF